MPLRRPLTVLCLGAAAAALAGACLPWTVEGGAVAGFVERGLRARYGVALAASDRTEVTLLPLPRLTFRQVRLNAGAADGPALVSGGSLSVQLDILRLLRGEVDIAALVLDGATIHLPQDAEDGRWAQVLARVEQRWTDVDGTHPRRITLNRATVTGHDPRDGTSQTARDVDLTLSWSPWSEVLAAHGGLAWNGAVARFALAGLRPRDLLEGRLSPLSANLSWPAGSLAVEGAAGLKGGLRVTGQGSLQTQALPRTLAWIGGDVALAPFIDDLSIEGSFEASATGVLVPAVRVRTGGNLLEGAGSASLGGHRAAVQATLAADTLNLSPLLAALLRLTGDDDPEAGAAGGSGRSIALGPLTGGDLDLRISAANARLGPVEVEDLASSVLVRAHGIEASLSRANLQGGTVKGRIALSADKADPARTRVRAMGSFDRLDLGGLLADLGEERWVLGTGQGSVLLEGAGHDLGGLARSVRGRAALTMDDGAIAGLDLADVIHRGGLVAAGALARRNGRTPFERAGLSLVFADGVGEIAGAELSARTLTAVLRGRVSLPNRRVEARAELLPRTSAEAPARPPTQFEIAGPWSAVKVLARTGQLGPGLGLATNRLEARPAALPAGIRAYAPAEP